MSDGKIKIRLKRSPICCPEKHKRVVRGLGFRKLNQVVERPDSSAIRGMIRKIPHLVEVVQ
ncbi:MAG TPA: 50S ribosomal protein L30 [Bryobacterales bacterium]|jgi:large subunit ribosomal protein L30|nr:50S ribosomal protein L30 [Bryobacterales bacterium]